MSNEPWNMNKLLKPQGSPREQKVAGYQEQSWARLLGNFPPTASAGEEEVQAPNARKTPPWRVEWPSL